MKLLRRETKVCPCCHKEHEVRIVRVRQYSIREDCEFWYEAIYEHCLEKDELYMSAERMLKNMRAADRAYTGAVNLAELMAYVYKMREEKRS